MRRVSVIGLFLFGLLAAWPESAQASHCTTNINATTGLESVTSVVTPLTGTRCISVDLRHGEAGAQVTQGHADKADQFFGFNPCPGNINPGAGICLGSQGMIAGLLDHRVRALFSVTGPGAFTNNMFGQIVDSFPSNNTGPATVTAPAGACVTDLASVIILLSTEFITGQCSGGNIVGAAHVRMDMDIGTRHFRASLQSVLAPPMMCFNSSNQATGLETGDPPACPAASNPRTTIADFLDTPTFRLQSVGALGALFSFDFASAATGGSGLFTAFGSGNLASVQQANDEAEHFKELFQFHTGTSPAVLELRQPATARFNAGALLASIRCAGVTILGTGSACAIQAMQEEVPGVGGASVATTTTEFLLMPARWSIPLTSTRNDELPGGTGANTGVILDWRTLVRQDTFFLDILGSFSMCQGAGVASSDPCFDHRQAPTTYPTGFSMTNALVSGEPGGPTFGGPGSPQASD